MSSFFSNIKVAIITDWMVSPGGADRLLLSILDLFEDADVFTTIYVKEKYFGTFEIPVNVVESFLGKSRILRRFDRHLNVLSPLAFESFDLSGYDLIISLSAGAAKGILPSIEQPHIGIILTPPRSLWSGESNIRALRLRRLYRGLAPLVNSYLRIWDLTAVDRIDHVISISEFIADKVKKTYRRSSKVIYPGISDFWFKDPTLSQIASEARSVTEKYFLVVSRLYDYKKVDWAIEAIQRTGKRLVIVGLGPDEPYLREISGPETIFLGWQNDETIKFLYKNAEALIFAGVEDFGYVPVEAMASGCPVLAYNKGGVTETVDEDAGAFFSSREELTSLIRSFERKHFDKAKIIANAKKFSETLFQQNLADFIKRRCEI